MKVGRTEPVVIKPGTVTLDAPSNGDTGVTQPDLTWSALSEATSYEVQLSTDQNFSSLILDSIDANTRNVFVPDVKESTIYYWRVRASNAGGAGPWSEVWHFTTVPIERPELISPDPNKFFSDILPYLFSWHSARHAKAYQITIADNLDFKHVIVTSGQIPDTTSSVNTPLADGDYFWKVQAFGDGGSSPNSETRNFNVHSSSAVHSEVGLNNFSLSNHPNPFSSKTTISYTLSNAGIVSLKMFDLLGREIRSLSEGFAEAGNYSLPFDRNSLSNGAYILRLEVNGKRTSQIVHVVK
jgi:hypothetical protein